MAKESRKDNITNKEPHNKSLSGLDQIRPPRDAEQSPSGNTGNTEQGGDRPSSGEQGSTPGRSDDK